MGRVNLGEVHYWSGDPQKSPGWVRVSWGGPLRVGGPSVRSETGRGTLGEVCYGSRGPLGGLGRVGGPSGRSGTGQGTLREVRDGSEDLLGGPGWVRRPAERSEMGRGP